MRTRRLLEALLAVGALAAAVAWALTAGGRAAPPVSQPPAEGWRGLVGDSRAVVSTQQRVIVLLKTPSLGQQVAAAGGAATEGQERAWTAGAFAAQQQVLATLGADGISVHPTYTYARVLDGFAASLDPRAIVLLDGSPEVEGVYPVRAAFPASFSQRVLSTKEFAAGSGRRAEADLPGADGRGVTIALLDTGVDYSHPFIRDRLLAGIDVVDPGGTAAARRDPQGGALERHGTELAGILAGSGGPGGLRGVAPGADILPIRVAGWQPDAAGKEAIYARTDQLLAGLDRAVDPNGDGDAHDAVRVALVGVAEPYAAFADGPEAQAVRGALELNTLVVAPAGNDGAAGPLFGSVAGPAGAPAALAVAATDGRTNTPSVRVVLRRGLDVVFDSDVSLLGAVAPSRPLTLPPAGEPTVGSTGFRNARGVSLVAGRIALAPVGDDPEGTALAAARAGARALVLYGDPLPAGALRVTERMTIPVVVVPAAPALSVLAAARARLDVGVTLSSEHDPANTERGAVTGFSSRGLAFDGRVKPDLAAPGVGIATSFAGTAADGSALYGTMNGTSAAAATVAGAAALLAQIRPALDGAALASLLAGYADPSGPPTQTGGGRLDLGASAVGEVAAAPTTLAFGAWTGPHWRSTQAITVRNVSTRRLQLSLSVAAGGDSEALHFTVVPDQLALLPGHSADVRVTVSATVPPRSGLVSGAVRIAAAGSETLRVPWAIAFRRGTPDLVARASLNRSSFAPSDTNPAVLSVQAGALVRSGDAVEVAPVSRLDVLLYRANGSFVGLLARLRDLLPGSYSFGITGRGPSSVKLPAGRYELRLVAWPALGGNARPSRAKVRFSVS